MPSRKKEKQAIERFIGISKENHRGNNTFHIKAPVSEDKFHLLVSNIPDVIWTTDENCHIVFISRNIEAITGHTLDEEYEMGQWTSWFDRVHPDDVECAKAVYKTLIESKKPYNIEYRFKRRDGKWIWIHDRAVATYEEDGMKYASGMLSEITERKQAELRIKELKENYETLIKNIPVVVYSTLPDETSTMTFVSDRWREWTGYSPQDTYREPQTWPNSVHPEDRKRAAQAYVEAYETRTEYCSEYRLVNKDSGRERWVVDHGIPVMDDNGGITRFDGIMQDITRRMEAEQALRDANDTLEMRVRERTTELGALSRQLVEAQESERLTIAGELHDQIGQSLTALKISLDRALRLPEQSTAVNLSEAKELVNELMAEVRDMSLNLRPPMLDDLGLLPTLLWYFERYTAQTEIQVNFKHRGLNRYLPPEIRTAAYRIIQEALTNVARYAMVSDVKVNAWSKDDLLSVRVEDMGTGFCVNALPFDKSIGLHGMQERALLLGGEVVVNSTPGSGTCITAKLPMVGAMEKGD